MKTVKQLDATTKQAHLAVFRLTRPDGKPFNYVWVFGNIERPIKKLFYVTQSGFIKTDMGKKYGAKFPTVPYRIELRSQNLKAICRDLKIRSILFIRYDTYE